MANPRKGPIARSLLAANVTAEQLEAARLIYCKAGLTLAAGYGRGRYRGWRVEGFRAEVGGAFWGNLWVNLANAVTEPQSHIEAWTAAYVHEART